MNLTAHPLSILAELTWSAGDRIDLRPRRRPRNRDKACAACGGTPQPGSVNASHHRKASPNRITTTTAEELT